MAGQIGLDPPTMLLVDGEQQLPHYFSEEEDVSSQSCSQKSRMLLRGNGENILTMQLKVSCRELLVYSMFFEPLHWACVGGAEAEAAQCILNCEAVAVAMKTDLQKGLLWCTAYASMAAGLPAAEELARQLHSFLQVRVAVENASLF